MQSIAFQYLAGAEMEHKVAKIKVDDEGYVKCPECGERKRCGTAGVENILKNHQGTKTFMKPHPKPVPSTVTADPVAQGQAGSSNRNHQLTSRIQNFTISRNSVRDQRSCANCGRYQE